jgi:hypothetical protein
LDGTPDATVNHRTRRLLAGLRILVAFLGGVAAVVVPTILIWNQYPSLIYLWVALGSFVVSVSAMKRPHWYLGTGFGFLMSLIPTAYVWVYGYDGAPASWQVLLYFLWIFVPIGSVLGSIGGLMGKLVGWGLAKNHRAGRLVSLKPWHLGVVALVIDLLATGMVLDHIR